jgi:predicted lipoprotein with Yx(FWY)xxD motif
MGKIIAGFAAIVILAAASGAAARWSNLSAPDGYSETVGATLVYADRESADASNCYDACAAIWGHSVAAKPSLAHIASR